MFKQLISGIMITVSTLTFGCVTKESNLMESFHPNQIQIEEVEKTATRSEQNDGIYRNRYKTMTEKGDGLKITNNTNENIKQIEFLFFDTEHNEIVKYNIGYSSVGKEKDLFIKPGESVESSEALVRGVFFEYGGYSGRRGYVEHEIISTADRGGAHNFRPYGLDIYNYEYFILLGIKIYTEDQYIDCYRESKDEEFEVYAYVVDGDTKFRHENYYDRLYK
jgi:hypothetical protein